MATSDQEPPTTPPAAPANPAPAGTTMPIEDASTQALAEALQSSFRVIKVLMVLLVAGFFLTGSMFTVQPDEVAVILRFGRPVGAGEEQLLKPGWHWSWPAPIDEVVRIPVGQSHTLVSRAGWYATTPELEALGREPEPRPSLQPGVDGYALTGDGNVIHVRAALTYRISPAQALDYAFNFANVTNVLRHVLDNAILYVAAGYQADAALYRETAGFKELVLARVNQGIRDLNLGVVVDSAELKTSAPLAVRPAFDAVLAAAQDRSRRISEARGHADELTRKAVGEATALVNAGLTSSNQLVQAVAAEASYFADQLPYFEKDPELFQRRLLTEAMQRILAAAQDKFFIPQRTDGRPRELRIQLNREPQAPPAPATP